MASLHEFFNDASADRLMDDASHPPSIREFLRQERLMLDALGSGVELLVEVGCMNGRSLDWAVAEKTRYLGIDIASRHVEAGRRRLTALQLSDGRCRFECGDATEVLAQLQPMPRTDARGGGLILFPFNIFGALDHPERVAASVARTGMACVISTYGTSADATSCRHEYYERCGYRNLHVCQQSNGVMFATAEGFQTISYTPDFLVHLWRQHGLDATIHAWSRLNVACVVPAGDGQGRPASRWY